MTSNTTGGRRPRVRGLFFDLYGTLLVYGDMHTAWSDWLRAIHAQVTRYDSTLTAEAIAAQCNQFFERPEPAPVFGLTIFERRILSLCRTFGLELPPSAVRRLADAAVRAWQSHITIDPAAHDVLGALRRRYRLALISNFDHPSHVHETLRDSALGGYFDAIIVSGDVGLKKPDPRIMYLASDSLEVSAEDCTYVGDTITDAACAEAAGMRAITISRHSDLNASPALDFRLSDDIRQASQAPPRNSIHSLSELLNL